MKSDARVCGIVAEFDPFHNGHKYLINQIRTKIGNDTAIVVVMSGNFVQRGEVSCFDKFTRAKSALINGADLIIELPVNYALSTAERFTFTGVKTLLDTGIVSDIAFGSECGNIQLLKEVAIAADDEQVYLKTADYLKSGITYAAARQMAVCDCFDENVSTLFNSPNDILAIGYISALNRLKSNVVMHAISRLGTSHNSNDFCGNITSAQNIRNMLKNGEIDRISDFVPENTVDLLKKMIEKNLAPVYTENGEQAILSRLRGMTEQQAALLPDVSEGLENRVYSAIKSACSLDELYSLIKTKRYTLSRIKRLILCAALGIEKNEPQSEYLRILGFNDKGAGLLKSIKSRGSLPIVTSFSDAKKVSATAEKEYIKTSTQTDFYNLLPPCVRRCSTELETAVVKI